jgi:uncharacterized protein YbaP (TraB family)
MNRQIFIRAFLLILLLSSQAFAGKLPLWELGGTSNRVLLMGSVHFLRSSDYPLPEAMTAAYQQADHLYMEIDMDSLNPMEAQVLLTSMGTGGQPLSETLSAENYAEANRRATDLGVPLMLFEQFEPWFAALSITQLRMMQLGFDPSWGIETRFTSKAAADGKSISGLETLEEQLGFMDQLDATTQEQFLLQSLEDAATLQEQADALVAAWRSGDNRSMEALMLEGFRSAPRLEDALLVQRNRNWVDPIMRLRNQPDNYLVIVGAMHLVGSNSVVAMLEDRGVEIRQLSEADLR